MLARALKKKFQVNSTTRILIGISHVLVALQDLYVHVLVALIQDTVALIGY